MISSILLTRNKRQKERLSKDSQASENQGGHSFIRALAYKSPDCALCSDPGDT